MRMDNALPAPSSTEEAGACDRVRPGCVAAAAGARARIRSRSNKRKRPSFTITSTRARSSMPLWLVADMLKTPWVPTTSPLLFERVTQRHAERLGSRPGRFQRDGNGTLEQHPASQVLAPKVAGMLPKRFWYAAM